MTPRKLEFEQRNLLQGELPYGFAWFLKLTVEYERWGIETGGSDPLRLRPMANDLASRLMNHYRVKKPSPDTGEYDNNSWALMQLYDYFEFTQNLAGMKEVQTWVRAGFIDASPSLDFSYDLVSGEFFSRFGNWALLILKTQEAPVARKFLGVHPVSEVHLALPEVGTIHSYGLIWSRALAFKKLATYSVDQRESDLYRQAYLQHFDEGMKLHERYKADFDTYGHWVPQFATLALTE